MVTIVCISIVENIYYMILDDYKIKDLKKYSFINPVLCCVAWLCCCAIWMVFVAAVNQWGELAGTNERWERQRRKTRAKRSGGATREV